MCQKNVLEPHVENNPDFKFCSLPLTHSLNKSKLVQTECLTFSLNQVTFHIHFFQLYDYTNCFSTTILKLQWIKLKKQFCSHFKQPNLKPYISVRKVTLRYFFLSNNNISCLSFTKAHNQHLWSSYEFKQTNMWRNLSKTLLPTQMGYHFIILWKTSFDIQLQYQFCVLLFCQQNVQKANDGSCFFKSCQNVPNWIRRHCFSWQKNLEWTSR